MKDRLPTINAIITARFPQSNDKDDIFVVLTLAEAQELHRQLGELVAPEPTARPFIFRSEPLLMPCNVEPYRITYGQYTTETLPNGDIRVTCGIEN